MRIRSACAAWLALCLGVCGGLEPALAQTQVPASKVPIAALGKTLEQAAAAGQIAQPCTIAAGALRVFTEGGSCGQAVNGALISLTDATSKSDCGPNGNPAGSSGGGSVPNVCQYRSSTLKLEPFGGGSQTPWTANVDAAGKVLSALGGLTGTSGNWTLDYDAAGQPTTRQLFRFRSDNDAGLLQLVTGSTSSSQIGPFSWGHFSAGSPTTERLDGYFNTAGHVYIKTTLNVSGLMESQANCEWIVPGGNSTLCNIRSADFGVTYADAEDGQTMFGVWSDTNAPSILARQGPGNTAVLVGATKSDEPERRRQALTLLHQTGHGDEMTVVTALGEALADADASVKLYAIQALAERRGSAALESLRHALRDPDPSVRMFVIARLVPEGQGLELLWDALADDEKMVRELAASRLEGANSAER